MEIVRSVVWRPIVSYAVYTLQVEKECTVGYTFARNKAQRHIRTLHALFLYVQAALKVVFEIQRIGGLWDVLWQKVSNLLFLGCIVYEKSLDT